MAKLSEKRLEAVSTDLVLCDIKNRIGILTFNRPEKRNALSLEMLAKLQLTLEEWVKNDSVRAVIITGSGEQAFSAGFDLQAIPVSAEPRLLEALKNIDSPMQALEALRQFPYPTIAMLNGDTFGLALNLALCCDIRIGADDIKVCMPPVKLGAVYHADGIKQFVEILGMARAKEVFFTGRVYAESEIITMGLVNRLVARDKLVSTTFAMAEEISENAPLSLKGIKKIINMIGDRSLLDEEEMSIADKLLDQGFNSQDLKEGQLAFLEKRKPKFLGY